MSGCPSSKPMSRVLLLKTVTRPPQRRPTTKPTSLVLGPSLSALCWRPRWRPRPPPPRVRRVVAPTTRLSVCGRWCLYPPANRPAHGLSHLLATAVRVFGGLSKTFTWSHSDFEYLRELTSPAFHSDLLMRIYTYPTAHLRHLSSPPGSCVLAVCNQNERVRSTCGPESTASTRTPASLPRGNSCVRGGCSGSSSRLSARPRLGCSGTGFSRRSPLYYPRTTGGSQNKLTSRGGGGP
jgi:hypothetical protein